MKLVVFFSLLCCLVLKGNCSTPTGLQSINFEHAISKSDIFSSFSEINFHDEANLTNNAGKTSDNDSLVSDDNIEDEDNSCLTFKVKFPLKSPSFYHNWERPSHGSYFQYRCSYLDVSGSFIGQVTYKYIHQGVLRI